MSTETTATETLTDDTIRAIRNEADGDLAVQHACDVALGIEEPVTTGEQWEERYGGGGHSYDEQRAVMRIRDESDARAYLGGR